MTWRRLHAWEVCREEAERIQSWLGAMAREAHKGPARPPTMFAGAAVSSRAAAVVVLDAENWKVVDASRVALPEAPRYQRGLMAFALGPPLLHAFEGIRSRPETALFHAHGLTHPRRCGMATHLGLLLEVPSVGCADTLLCGDHEPPGLHRGDWTPVTDGSQILGACVRTAEGSKPLIVSPGYSVRVEEAVDLVLRSTCGHRLAEPLRQARALARGV